MKKIEGGITAAKGFQAAGGAAGISSRRHTHPLCSGAA